jgi:hypothetical protein
VGVKLVSIGLALVERVIPLVVAAILAAAAIIYGLVLLVNTRERRSLRRSARSAKVDQARTERVSVQPLGDRGSV